MQRQEFLNFIPHFLETNWKLERYLDSFEKYILEDSGSPCVFHLLCFIWIKKMKYLLIQISQYVHMILPKILEFLNFITVRNLWWKVVLISFILKREIALGKEISDMGMNLHKNMLENNFNVFFFFSHGELWSSNN